MLWYYKALSRIEFYENLVLVSFHLRIRRLFFFLDSERSEVFVPIRIIIIRGFATRTATAVPYLSPSSSRIRVIYANCVLYNRFIIVVNCNVYVNYRHIF